MANVGERITEYSHRHYLVSKWRERFESLDCTRADFCRKYGVDQTQLARWLAGKHAPNKRIVKKIEKALEEEGC